MSQLYTTSCKHTRLTQGNGGNTSCILSPLPNSTTEEHDIDGRHKNFHGWPGHDGHAGTVAVIPRTNGQHKVMHYHLGELVQHTVYECELVGLLLASKLIRHNPSIPKPFHIFLNNQVAIKAPLRIVTRSGQQLVQAIYLALCKPRPPEIYLHWIVGHEGILGNELMDEHTKCAAAGESSPQNQLPTLPHKALLPNPVGLAAGAPHTAEEAVEIPQECIPVLLEASGIRSAPVTSLPLPTARHVNHMGTSQSSFSTMDWTHHPRQSPYTTSRKQPRLNVRDRCPTELVVHYLFECPAHLHERIRHFCQWCHKERNLLFLLSAPKSCLEHSRLCPRYREAQVFAWQAT